MPRLVAPAARGRFLSSGPQGTASQAATALTQALSWARQNRTTVFVIAGMTCVMYGFYRGSVRLMKFFLHVPPQQIFTAGFIGGILAGIVIAVSALLVQRRMTFHVDEVFGAAVRELRKNPKVEAALGEAWHPGGFRGYSVESLQEATVGSERRVRSSYFEAPSRRVQMIFMVRGMERDAMVSLEAFKREGDYHFDMLSLDLKAKPGLPAEHIFLEGSSDHILFCEITELLTSTRASGRTEKIIWDQPDAEA